MEGPWKRPFSVCLSVRPSIRLSVSLSVFLFVCLSVSPSVWHFSQKWIIYFFLNFCMMVDNWNIEKPTGPFLQIWAKREQNGPKIESSLEFLENVVIGFSWK